MRHYALPMIDDAEHLKLPNYRASNPTISCNTRAVLFDSKLSTCLSLVKVLKICKAMFLSNLCKEQTINSINLLNIKHIQIADTGHVFLSKYCTAIETKTFCLKSFTGVKNKTLFCSMLK